MKQRRRAAKSSCSCADIGGSAHIASTLPEFCADADTELPRHEQHPLGERDSDSRTVEFQLAEFQLHLVAPQLAETRMYAARKACKACGVDSSNMADSSVVDQAVGVE